MTAPAWLGPASIATGLWLGALAFLSRLWIGRPGTTDPAGGSPFAPRWEPLSLGALSFLFLGGAIRSGVNQDYYLYLGMWREVRLGHDPWFQVQGVFGTYPLNAYGPVFNLLCIPAWLHPLLPKLLFATSYALFASWLVALATRGTPCSLAGRLLLLAWLWNPFVWVEIAHYGHFDVLVALLCVWAMEARARGRDVASGGLLGVSVLLKYMPIVLVPFLVLDGRRIRWRLLSAAAAVIVLGLGASILCWGPSVFRPLTFAASRSSQHLSIYRFLRSSLLPLAPARLLNLWALESWAPLILFLALLRTWSWHRTRGVAAEPASVVAMFVTVLLYQVGFSQYQMVPFVLLSWWLVRRKSPTGRRWPLILSLAVYYGWISVFDILDVRVGTDFMQMQEWAGLLTFLLGLTVLASVVASARRSSCADPGQVAMPAPAV